MGVFSFVLPFFIKLPFNSPFQWLIQCLETLNREDEEVCRLKVPQLLMAQDGGSSSRIVINSSSGGGGSNCCTPTKISSDDSMAQHTLSSLLLSPIYDKSFEEVNLIVDKADLKKQAITQELYQTEVNYVTILKDILKVKLEEEEEEEEFFA